MKELMLKLTVLITVILCLGKPSSSFAQSAIFSAEKYVNATGEVLNYRQLTPKSDATTNYPLVIFLHGSGERGKDNEAQLKWGVLDFASEQNMKKHPSIVIAPQCPKNMSWDNFSEEDMSLKEQPSKPMQLLIELINQSIKNLPVDANRVYITGLSMGGYGTYDALLRYPNLFAAAVPVCGAGDVTKASSIAHIPIWIFHGAIDDAVSPAYSHDMIRALTEAGASPGFTQYPEVGHFSWVPAYQDTMMIDWLFNQENTIK